MATTTGQATPTRAPRTLRVVEQPQHALRRAVRRYRTFRGTVPAAHPPACPPGWAVGPPDWVGVGVQKGGTSWWHRMIATHPEMSQADGLSKELHFFDRYFDTEFSDADAAAYTSFFPRPPGGMSGEWTPRYLFDFWVPPLLARAAPQAKVLVLLRDPVERYRSGLSHEVDTGSTSSPVLAQETMQRGLYAAQLTRLLSCFPREQVLVLQYERCRAEPQTQLARTFSFLGLRDATFAPPTVAEVVNRSRSAKAALPAHVREQLVTAYSADIAVLRGIVPDLDLRLWPNFAHLTSATEPA